MANFRYKVRDKYGRSLDGAMAGENKDAILAYLKKMGYTPITIDEVKGNFVAKDFFSRFIKIQQEEMIMFSRQLVTLQSAGLPLLMSLQAIKEQTESKALKEVITEINLDVESGSSFAEALGRHPDVFNELYVNMVKSGEASGTLDEVLERLASLAEQQMETQSKLGPITVRTDSSVFPKYDFFNCAIMAVREINMSGDDAGYVVTVTGYYIINSDLWNLV